MPKSKPPGHAHKHASHKTHLFKQNDDMDKVKIKRVKRNKKKPTTSEKVLAGIGLGTTLLGGAGVVAPKTNQTQFVRTESENKSSAKSIVKDTLQKIFGIQQAKANEADPSNPGGWTGDEMPQPFDSTGGISDHAGFDNSMPNGLSDGGIDASSSTSADTGNVGAYDSSTAGSLGTVAQMADSTGGGGNAVVDPVATAGEEAAASGIMISADGSGGTESTVGGIDANGNETVGMASGSADAAVSSDSVPLMDSGTVADNTAPIDEGSPSGTESVINNNTTPGAVGETEVSSEAPSLELHTIDSVSPAAAPADPTSYVAPAVTEPVTTTTTTAPVTASTETQSQPQTGVALQGTVTPDINDALKGTVIINGQSMTVDVLPDGRIFDTNGQDVTGQFSDSDTQGIRDAFSAAGSFAAPPAPMVGVTAPTALVSDPVSPATVDVLQEGSLRSGSSGTNTEIYTKGQWVDINSQAGTQVILQQAQDRTLTPVEQVVFDNYYANGQHANTIPSFFAANTQYAADLGLGNGSDGVTARVGSDGRTYNLVGSGDGAVWQAQTSIPSSTGTTATPPTATTVSAIPQNAVAVITENNGAYTATIPGTTITVTGNSITDLNRNLQQYNVAGDQSSQEVFIALATASNNYVAAQQAAQQASLTSGNGAAYDLSHFTIPVYSSSPGVPTQAEINQLFALGGGASSGPAVAAHGADVTAYNEYQQLMMGDLSYMQAYNNYLLSVNAGRSATPPIKPAGFDQRQAGQSTTAWQGTTTTPAVHEGIATPTPPQTYTASVNYSTNGNATSPQVGDKWTIVVTGMPGQTVYASDTTDKNTPMGIIGQDGKLLLSGTFSLDDLANGGKPAVWNETWSVGTSPATAKSAGAVNFNVSPYAATSGTVAATTGTNATYGATIKQNGDGTFTVTLNDANHTSITAADMADLGAQMQDYNVGGNKADQKILASFGQAGTQISQQVYASDNSTSATTGTSIPTLTFQQNVKGGGPTGSYNLNNAYYATQDTANWLAQKYGGTVISVTPQMGGMFNYPDQLYIKLPDGTMINAGQLATYYNAQGETAAQNMIKGEQTTHVASTGSTTPDGVTVTKWNYDPVQGYVGIDSQSRYVKIQDGQWEVSMTDGSGNAAWIDLLSTGPAKISGFVPTPTTSNMYAVANAATNYDKTVARTSTPTGVSSGTINGGGTSTVITTDSAQLVFMNTKASDIKTFAVGETWEIRVTGQEGSTVYVTGGKNGAQDTTPMGTIKNGILILDGQITADQIGSWNETWKIGNSPSTAKIIGNLSFAVVSTRAATSSAVSAQAPTITAMSTSGAVPGTPLSILGSNFSSAVTVQFLSGSSVKATVNVTPTNSGSLMVTVPSLVSGAYEIKVLNGGSLDKASNAFGFNVLSSASSIGSASRLSGSYATVQPMTIDDQGNGAVSSNANTNVDAIKTQIADLQQQIRTLQNSSSSNGMSSQITALQQQIQTLQNTIVLLQNQNASRSGGLYSSGSINASVTAVERANLNSQVAGTGTFQGLKMPSGYPASNDGTGLKMPEGFPASESSDGEVAGASATSYTVKKGDTLWSVATKVYGDGSKWRKILSANPKALSTPGDTKTLIVGYELTIPQI